MSRVFLVDDFPPPSFVDNFPPMLLELWAGYFENARSDIGSAGATSFNTGRPSSSDLTCPTRFNITRSLRSDIRHMRCFNIRRPSSMVDIRRPPGANIRRIPRLISPIIAVIKLRRHTWFPNFLSLQVSSVSRINVAPPFVPTNCHLSSIVPRLCPDCEARGVISFISGPSGHCV